MTLRRSLMVLMALTLAGWGAFLVVLFRLEPCSAPGEITMCYSVSSLGISLFFASAFLALAATFTLLGFGLRWWFEHDQIYLDHLTASLRQGLLLTFCALGACILLLLQALTWWSGFLLITIIIFVELYLSRF